MSLRRSRSLSDIQHYQNRTDYYVSVHNGITSKEIPIKPNATIKDLMVAISQSYPELKDNYILKTGTGATSWKLGAKNASCQMKLIEVWPDTYKRPKIDIVLEKSLKKENQIYMLKNLFLLDLDKIQNLHGNCPINCSRIGRKDNKVPNLIEIITPYGNYLVNMHSLKHILESKPTPQLFLNDHAYPIPKPGDFLRQLCLMVQNLDEPLTSKIDFVVHESPGQKLNRFFFNTKIRRTPVKPSPDDPDEFKKDMGYPYTPNPSQHNSGNRLLLQLSDFQIDNTQSE